VTRGPSSRRSTTPARTRVRAYYDGLPARHGFTDPGSASITPMHAITWARRPLPSVGAIRRRA
jgi:hypothetical protein